MHWRGFRDGCRDCHEQEGERHHFTMESSPDLCLVCHDSVLESSHEHDPAREDCLDCHEPHGSQHAQLLTEVQPELCFLCHDEERVLEGEMHHKPVEQGRCSDCHEPHAAPHAGLLAKAGTALCESCHREVLDRLRDLPHKHQPLREGDCQQCHRPHASEHAWLLGKPFPRSLYQGFETGRYGLCFGCHEESLATEARTRSATGFRDGSRNLHFVHVDRAQRGRSCRACHDPHAGDNPFLVKQSPRYGSWQMPMKFQVLETGGSCAPGCHEAQSYDRETP
jgi:predicted CXXCH cytochrome family protein